MRKLTTLALAAALALTAALAMAQETKPAEPSSPEAASTVQAAPATAKAPALNTLEDKAGYLIGVNIGRNLAQADIKDSINFDTFVAGLRDGIEGKDPVIPEQQAMMILQEFSQNMDKKIAERAEKNKAASDAFLAGNKTKEGVKTTASGLQYKITEEGKGAQPKATDMVKVNYRGTLLDGTEFDSSYERGEPAEFPLNRVIPGWSEGLQLMKVGGKATLWIPGELAYGENPPGPPIEANSLLMFEVELLEIMKPDASQLPQFSIEPPQ